jgi:aspartate carbamoyltransferase regulatory subunit
LSRFKLCKVFTNQNLHLKWIEMLLVSHHIPQACLNVLNLFELNKKHAIELLEVLPDVIVCYTAI